LLSTDPSISTYPDATALSAIASAIKKQGYLVLPSFISDTLLQNLITRIKSLQANDLKMAGIGRGIMQQKNVDIRRDRIQWLDKKNKTDSAFLELMESLRQYLNQQFFLGLFDYESHYAVYQQSDFYRKHLDALKGKSNRVLSTVLYLNEQWHTDNAGELILYAPDGKTVLETVQPAGGTIVIFLSEQFPHEVMAANKTRYSIAGWFRLNASSSDGIDTAE